MSSPITPLLFKHEGQWRLHLSGWQTSPFKATETRFQQGKDFPKSMKMIGDPLNMVTDEEAVEALDDAVKYYSKTK